MVYTGLMAPTNAAEDPLMRVRSIHWPLLFALFASGPALGMGKPPVVKPTMSEEGKPTPPEATPRCPTSDAPGAPGVICDAVSKTFENLATNPPSLDKKAQKRLEKLQRRLDRQAKRSH